MMRQREKVIPRAKGKVLEIGVGSGLNLSYYNADQVDHLTLIDPTPAHSALQKNRDQVSVDSEFIVCGAESMPVESNSFDTVVATYSFCTIPDLASSFEEIRRVLKPKGQVLFIEHGLAPDESVRKTQNRVNPYWKRIAGGCNLNRDIPALMRQGGFQLNNLETMYLPGWKPATYNVWGSAVVK